MKALRDRPSIELPVSRPHRQLHLASNQPLPSLPLTEPPETANLQSMEVVSGPSIHLPGPNFAPKIQYGRLCDNYVYNLRVRLQYDEITYITDTRRTPTDVLMFQHVANCES